MRAALMSIIVLLLAPMTLAQTRPSDVSVTLMRIVEKRERAVEKVMTSSFDSGVTLTLRIAGPGVNDARKYGDVVASKAVDDAGTDLTASTGHVFNQSRSFKEVREPMTRRVGQGEHSGGFEVELRLPTPSKRAAKSIPLVSGSVQVLVGGEKKVVEVKPLKQQLGKVIDDPALKALGINVTLPRDQAGGDVVTSVTVEITGALDAVGTITINDASGRKLNRSWFASDMSGKRSISYDLDKPLPDDAVMQMEVWPGQKTVTVPFELKNIELP